MSSPFLPTAVSRTSPVAALLLLLAGVTAPAHAADVIHIWNGASGTNWSVTASWDTGTPADDTNPSDGDNVVLRTGSFSSQRTLILDSSRTVGKIWYNTDGAGADGNTASGGLTISAINGSILTLATDNGTPQIAAGRINDTPGTGSITINAVLAGTQGFTVRQESSPYRAGGLILTNANTISGTVSGYGTLALHHVQALEFANIGLTSSGTLRLRSDTDNATFLTAGMSQTTNSSTTTINVDRTGTGTGTDYTLKLAGALTINSTTGTKTLNITGGNGYSLEMTGAIVNASPTSAFAINPNSANVKLSNTVALGVGGIQLGGTMATGINEISGVISGTGPLTKQDVSTWRLSAANDYTGATSVTGGVLEVAAGGSLNTTSGITVSGGSFRYGGTTALNRTVTVNTGGEFLYNSATAFAGVLILNNGKVGGGGNLSNTALAIGTGVTLSPGNSPGTISTGTETWAGGGTYLWEMNDADGAQGGAQGWDWANITGDLNITATSGSQFTIQITGLTLANASGIVTDFDNTQGYLWTIATVSGQINGFDTAAFNLDATAFTDNNALAGGTFSIEQSGTSLNLRFSPVPEPSASLALLAGLTALGAARRRR